MTGDSVRASPPLPPESGPVRLLVRLALTRPHLLVPAWAAALSGAATLPSARLDGTVLPAAVGWSLLLAAGHVLNLWRDRGDDGLNRKNEFWRGRVAAGRLPRIAMVLSVAGLALALTRPSTIGPVAVSGILVVAYNLPPADLARRYGWDLAAHLGGFAAVAAWWGQTLVGAPAMDSWLRATAYLIGPVTAGFLWTTLMDREGDRRSAKRTWAVRWGAAATSRLGLAAAAATIPLGWPLLGDRVLPPGGLLVVAAVVASRRRDHRRWLRALVVVAVAAAGFPGALRWPAVASIMAGGALLTLLATAAAANLAPAKRG